MPDNLDDDPAARLLLGYDAATKNYYTVGLGGYRRAYVVHECRGNTHRLLHGVGQTGYLQPSATYDIAASVHSDQVTLAVNGISVFKESLPRKLSSQPGVFAYAKGVVKFESFEWTPKRAKAFVVMQFGDPYDNLYERVIKRVCEESGFDVERADDIYRPGVILQDITAALDSADVVIAEISPDNPNVFYEVGFAHARRTPTILLARHHVKLPFDVSGYRTIFYADTIGGKDDVESDLRRHLAHIR